MTHNAGIFGNDTDGYTPDCMECGPLENPQDKDSALKAARFHFHVWNVWGK